MAELPNPLVSSRSEYLGGIPCFHGTRVPVKNLFDYLAKGYPLEEFLIDFPDISRDHAVAVLVQASQQTIDAAEAQAKAAWAIMRILLDACLPVRFRHDLASAGTVQTARFAGLSRLENGALLSAMEGSFDVLITMDRGIRYQQSIAGRSVSVLILRAPSNALDDLRPLVPAILAALTTIAPGMVVEV